MKRKAPCDRCGRPRPGGVCGGGGLVSDGLHCRDTGTRDCIAVQCAIEPLRAQLATALERAERAEKHPNNCQKLDLILDAVRQKERAEKAETERDAAFERAERANAEAKHEYELRQHVEKQRDAAHALIREYVEAHDSSVEARGTPSWDAACFVQHKCKTNLIVYGRALKEGK